MGSTNGDPSPAGEEPKKTVAWLDGDSGQKDSPVDTLQDGLPQETLIQDQLQATTLSNGAQSNKKPERNESDAPTRDTHPQGLPSQDTALRNGGVSLSLGEMGDDGTLEKMPSQATAPSNDGGDGKEIIGVDIEPKTTSGTPPTDSSVLEPVAQDLSSQPPERVISEQEDKIARLEAEVRRLRAIETSKKEAAAKPTDIDGSSDITPRIEPKDDIIEVIEYGSEREVSGEWSNVLQDLIKSRLMWQIGGHSSSSSIREAAVMEIIDSPNSSRSTEELERVWEPELGYGELAAKQRLLDEESERKRFEDEKRLQEIRAKRRSEGESVRERREALEEMHAIQRLEEPRARPPRSEKELEIDRLEKAKRLQEQRAKKRLEAEHARERWEEERARERSRLRIEKELEILRAEKRRQNPEWFHSASDDHVGRGSRHRTNSADVLPSTTSRSRSRDRRSPGLDLHSHPAYNRASQPLPFRRPPRVPPPIVHIGDRRPRSPSPPIYRRSESDIGGPSLRQRTGLRDVSVEEYMGVRRPRSPSPQRNKRSEGDIDRPSLRQKTALRDIHPIEEFRDQGSQYARSYGRDHSYLFPRRAGGDPIEGSSAPLHRGPYSVPIRPERERPPYFRSRRYYVQNDPRVRRGEFRDNYGKLYDESHVMNNMHESEDQPQNRARSPILVPSSPAQVAMQQDVRENSDWINYLKSKSLLPSQHEEINWSGKGQHVEYSDTSEIPLVIMRNLGYSANCLVEQCRFQRYLIARKTIQCSRRMTKEQALIEVEHLQRLSHPHIVQLIGSYVLGKKFAILLFPAADFNLEEFMEMCDGLKAESLERTSLLSFTSCLISTMTYIHDERIKHMDIKPKNILVRSIMEPLEPYRIYLADFGIAKSYKVNEDMETNGITAFTRTYAAPEVVMQETRGTKADIFSLGCVFAEMFTVLSDKSLESFVTARQGGDEDEDSAYHSNLERVLLWLASLNPSDTSGLLSWPKWFSVIKQMLQEDPNDRPSATDLLIEFKGQKDCCTGEPASFDPNYHRSRPPVPSRLLDDPMACDSDSQWRRRDVVREREVDLHSRRERASYDSDPRRSRMRRQEYAGYLPRQTTSRY